MCLRCGHDEMQKVHHVEMGGSVPLLKCKRCGQYHDDMTPASMREINERLEAAAEKGRRERPLKEALTRTLRAMRQDIREEAHRSVLIEQMQKERCG